MSQGERSRVSTIPIEAEEDDDFIPDYDDPESMIVALREQAAERARLQGSR